MNLDLFLFHHRKEISRDSFSSRIGITKTHLSRILNGIGIPSIKLAKKIEEETHGEVTWQEAIEEAYNKRLIRNNERKNESNK